MGKMAYEMAAMRKRWAPLAWEMGPCAEHYPGLPQASQRAMPEAATGPAVPMAARTAAEVAPEARGRLTGIRKKSGPPPGMIDEKERNAALGKWVVILKALAARGAMAGKFRPAKAAFYIAECAAVKATNTLFQRAG